MTLLEIITKVSARSGIPRPVSAVGSTDDRILQLVGLLEEECSILSSRHPWSSLIRETTFVTTANESQGRLTDLASGFDSLFNQTMYDRTDLLEIYGPLSAADWQDMKARQNTGPRYQFRIQGGELLVNPVPAAGHTWAFEYRTLSYVLGSDGLTLKTEFTADDDTILLPDKLAILGLRWRWLAEKGLEYAQVFADYEAMVKDTMGLDGGKDVLRSDGRDRNKHRGVFVPNGSWTL